MKFIPILYSTPMVQAIYADRKNQTRRLKGLEKINKSPDDFVLDSLYYSKMLSPANPSKSLVHYIFAFKNIKNNEILNLQCPYGQPGDVLWVRETFFCTKYYENAPLFQGKGKYVYKADVDFIGCHKWNPSIHMPKEAARLFLRIKDIRVERLQDISEQDIQNEGIVNDGMWILGKENNALSFLPEGVNFRDNPPTLYQSLFAKWAELWCSINKIDSWNSNPWVWVIEFEKIEKPENFI